ncbi:YgaP-like transmembrane domain [Kaarinaea lacus]
MLEYNNASISKHEAVVRIFTGVMLILAVLLNITAPPWFALVAIYPIMSGIIQWDPLVGVVLLLRDKVNYYLCRKIKITQRKAYSF